MKRVDRLWFKLISEILVNLSAGWIGLTLTVPFAENKDALVKFGLLTGNITLAIVSLMGAFRLRKKGSKYD
ncbi:MAG: hypothetical protein HYW62_03340 [Candidatus Levybacteria bacterium]|nr:hypothetical protein [Candidatus Levybacteria bacterium]